ncbi:hypothetical protein F4809DRAFT_588431 [Biscogniauxia mediterranea]|nr:hypothetical protein F4809DRAFT_588431 [Biscogniauxia mediterranea]
MGCGSLLFFLRLLVFRIFEATGFFSNIIDNTTYYRYSKIPNIIRPVLSFFFSPFQIGHIGSCCLGYYHAFL